jgi:hypothetical protein
MFKSATQQGPNSSTLAGAKIPSYELELSPWCSRTAAAVIVA